MGKRCKYATIAALLEESSAGHCRETPLLI
jgi:hypothetical protein